MNLIEAYLKYFNQLVILLIGYPCTNKSTYANDLSIDTSLNVLNINDYLIKDKFVEKTIITDISNNKETKFKIYEHSDNVDWTKFNFDVNNLKSKGVIIHANLMDKDKLDFNIDFSFYFYSPIKYCKDNILQNNLLNLEKKDINNYFEHVFIPFYSNYDQNIKNIFTIFKFFKITETSNIEDIYNTLFDSLMTNINNNINKKLNVKPFNTLNRTNKRTNNKPIKINKTKKN